MALLEIRDLQAEVDGKEILKGINLTVEAFEDFLAVDFRLKVANFQ